jgi:RNA polymerase sigma-70 factor (ECF subfamily)
MISQSDLLMQQSCPTFRRFDKNTEITTFAHKGVNPGIFKADLEMGRYKTQNSDWILFTPFISSATMSWRLVFASATSSGFIIGRNFLSKNVPLFQEQCAAALRLQQCPACGGGVNQVSKSLDELLVERAKRGDVEAFEQLISQYERKVYNLAYRLTGSHEDASDVAQEAFIRAYSSLPEFRGDSSFATWLFRIANNACLDELRKRKRQRVTSLDEPLSTSDGEMDRQIALADEADSPEHALERVEIQRAVQESINALDEEYRIAIVMRDIQGYSYNEIADALGINLGTVKSRINRARSALKEMFGRVELLSPRVVYSGRRGKAHEL